MSSGLGRGWSWNRLSLVIGGLVAHFQCRLFRLVQALIFGDPAGLLGLLRDHVARCLVVWAGSCIVGLELIIVG